MIMVCVLTCYVCGLSFMEFCLFFPAVCCMIINIVIANVDCVLFER